MQPSSKVALDAKAFEVLKRTMKNVVIPHRKRKLDPAFKTEMPEVVALKLTNRCNLRCKHCYQWNESGYHHDMDKAEQNWDMDTAVFQRVLNETRATKSRLYLWGGEPLFHRDIRQILAMLEEDPRETTICTNAYLIQKYEEELCRISPDLELLIAIEGFEKEHDLIRGKGSFNKVMEQIDRLILLREQGKFQGKISVHSVINDSMIGRLHELMNFFEKKGIDLVLLCFPWFISHETSDEMDTFFQEEFQWLNPLEDQRRSSWHAFKYHIKPENVPALMEDLRQINAQTWRTRIRYQPGLDFDEIEDFVSGNSMTSRCATNCLALSTRADITPTGNVSACKFFSEFSVGNLQEQSLSEIWNSDAYDRIRRSLGKQLSPACSKCNVLYLHGSSSLAHI
ncbi:MULTISPECIES: radical SAM/SPASM domain-containing protein [unclassified Paenibacillus]|uniref:radical SAM/SPASM domain-containing protein n=1 Tax=unclassified Paenibacillus TaxID=185978 RepID=UPI0009A7B7F6|nr:MULTISPECIES: radical SAM protein [unclassified Paenibacillus]SLK20859.1 radical SAM additional 4Fe4S-binding SPASM domain-containing protein [Paenibacillus sp. RU5A]SOC76336.1 radical SAM additional 4Fe4S-binding SPASM domain-containing protein [Paenibacillus sp. RU26A]SOC77951.1 radical SAM additional 4Fe4S-binding SPASM domain-containing protein [Paenibacillus sp. RU5M]